MKNAKNACFSHFLDRFCEKPCKKGQKSTKKVPKPCIFVPFEAVHGFSRLVPDWFPISKKWCWNLPKAVSSFGPKFAELDDFLGFGKCFGGFGAGGG